MNRAEFDRAFQATLQTTEGYTESELDAINDQVFEAVKSLDIYGTIAKSAVDHEFERAFDRCGETVSHVERFTTAGDALEEIEPSRLNAAGITAINEFVQEHAKNVVLGGWLAAAEEAYENRGAGTALIEVRASLSRTGEPVTLTLDPSWFTGG